MNNEQWFLLCYVCVFVCVFCEYDAFNWNYTYRLAHRCFADFPQINASKLCLDTMPTIYVDFGQQFYLFSSSFCFFNKRHKYTMLNRFARFKW